MVRAAGLKAGMTICAFVLFGSLWQCRLTHNCRDKSTPPGSSRRSPLCRIQPTATFSLLSSKEDASAWCATARLLGTDFLNLDSSVACCGERGLLGLAFAPDYASSGRFYVNFTNTSGDTVVARFTRSAPDRLPILRRDSICSWTARGASSASLFQITTADTLRSGPMAISTSASATAARATTRITARRTRTSCSARCCASMSTCPTTTPSATGFRPTIRFSGRASARDEIWAFGLRNPWRYSFDDVTRGGTGALVIADVGQSSREEINYEPRGAGGRNYGWRNREGDARQRHLAPAVLCRPPIRSSNTDAAMASR